MKALKIFFLTLTFSLLSCAHHMGNSKTSEDIKLEKLLDDHMAQNMERFPEWSTWKNYKDGIYNDRWSDNSMASIEKNKDYTRSKLEDMKEIDRDDLSEQGKLNYDLYVDGLKEDIEGFDFRGEYLILDQLGGFQLGIAQLLSRMPTRHKRDYENILARFEKVPEIIENNITRLKEGLKLGITPPQVTLADVPNQFKSLFVNDYKKNPLTGSFKKFPKEISKADQSVMIERAKKALVKAIASYKKAYDFVVNEYIPGARKEIAYSALPNGKKWYNYRVRGFTTTDMTADEIHELGLSEVKRIRQEMEAVKKKTGFKGSFKQFLKYLRTNKRFFFTKKEDLLKEYRNIGKIADSRLLRVFNVLPRTPYGIEPTAAYAEKSAPTAYYTGGTPSAGRPGIFWANTYNLKMRPKWEMRALTLHEAVPGHHLQISLAQELEDVPEFRKSSHYTAYVEGWGLYAESLGEEMEMYEDEYDKFGQLTYEMWRAVRLVVDTGMHAKGWSRQQAINFFKENTPKTLHDITVEVDRYIIWPGQALAYKIGELKFKELRAKAKKALGEKFDLREYHNQVLKDGALPLNILETKIDQWIASLKS